MSAKLSKDLLAAHMNALHQTLGAVEAQVASVKTVLKLAKGGKNADADEDEAEDEDDAPAKPAKGKNKKPKDDEDEDESDDEEDESEADDEDESDDEEDESEADDEDESEDEEEDSKPKKGVIKKTQVIKALKAYATDNTKKAAMGKLKKLGCSNIHELDAAKYPKLLASLSK